MRECSLLRASRRFYARKLIILGAAGFLASALISADFLAGDSVRKSIAAHNLGKIGSATHLLAASTPFLADLDRRIEANAKGVRAASILELPLISATSGGITERGLTVSGIDGGFLSFYKDHTFAATCPHRGELWLNKNSAALLGCTDGERVVLRIPRASSGEVLQPAARGLPEFSDREFTITRILEDTGPGRFQIEITQRPPLLFYVNRDELGELSGVAGRANRVLIEAAGEFILPKATIRPGDAGLTLSPSPQGVLLRSAAYFISPSILGAAREAIPGGEAIYSSFLYTAESGDGIRPYLFFVSSDGDTQVKVSPLLARETGAGPGKELTLDYFVFSNDDGSLTRRKKRISVDAIATDAELLSRRDEVPGFPGLDEGRSCREWESSLPIDLSLVSDSVEADWKRHGKRPLLILDSESARAISPDPVIYRAPSEFSLRSVEDALAAKLDAQSIGARIVPLRDELIAASRGSVDFSALFIAMSFFLIAAMLFMHAVAALQFIGSRRTEAGVLRAIGFHTTKMQLHYLREILPFIIIPGAAGSVAGIALVHLLLAALRTVWYGIVHTDALSLFVAPRLIVIAFIAGTLPVIVVSSLVIHSRLQRMSAKEIALAVPGISRKKKILLSLCSLACLLTCITTALAATRFRSVESALFFLSGTFLLGAALSFILLVRARTPLRDRAILIVTAVSLFITASVSANRRLMNFDPAQSKSPTGGRTFIVETASGIPDDRFPATGRMLIPFTVYGKERANCLNLNDLRRPGILGFDGEIMDREKIFTLKSPRGEEIAWKSLSSPLADGSIPAAVDASVLQWSLKLSPGDRIVYRISASKQISFTIIAITNNTCLQGMLYADRKLLYNNFKISDSSVFLAGSEASERERRYLGRLFAPWGGSIRSTTAALSLFMELENTYLRIFQTMSMLAFIPGFIGLALLVRSSQIDDAAQRRLMTALGFSRRTLRAIFLQRNAGLLAVAAALSAAAALLSALPLIRGGYIGDILKILAFFYGAALATGTILIAALSGTE